MMVDFIYFEFLTPTPKAVMSGKYNSEICG